MKVPGRSPQCSHKGEGNTDELGGIEYNLALGQKRAEAVTRALKVYGVKDSQTEAVSFGEEKTKGDRSYRSGPSAEIVSLI